ncbi:MAG TPA: type II CAAX endopeptidase family protein [Terriglobales bacterium]|nr:type II CAAX endopeptidase family protein [Terriglobales bacterium]
MPALGRGWKPIPVIIRAVITGSVVCLAGTMGWSILLGLNLKFAPSIPWALAVMTVLLWTYWRYLGGKGWPRSTAETRRASLRVQGLSGILWIWALTAGVLSVASLVNLQLVYARFVRVPTEQVPDFSRYPFITVLCALLMSAVVAGLMEEAGFRGYMQVPIERRYGPWTASIVVAILFGLWHLPHGFAYTAPRLPYYFAISITYSAIAYLSNSLMPVVAIHACGDAVEFVFVWLRGAPREKPLLWQSGPDTAFWAELGLGVVFGLLAISAYRKLASVSQLERGTSPASHGVDPRPETA